MNEFDIIKRYFSPLAGAKGAFALSDDAAVVSVPAGMELVVTKDAITEGVHFIGNEPPSLIAQKLLRVNLSDLAAMGAKPYAYFLALMLPETIDEHWIKSFAEGLQAVQETFGITLMGGDTTRSRGTLSLSVTALGLIPQGKALRRNGAKAGDDVYVSGTIGDAALGLKVASEDSRVASRESSKDMRGYAEESFTTTPQGRFRGSEIGGSVPPITKNVGGDTSPPYNNYLLQRYQLPSPRIELGQLLHDVATSCMDISDGLMQDMGHIAGCSDVQAIIEWDKIPLSEAAQSVLPHTQNPYDVIAGGGDDYELLFTAPAASREIVQAVARKTAAAITRIGCIKEGRGVKLIDKDGSGIYVSRTGYDHFKSI